MEQIQISHLNILCFTQGFTNIIRVCKLKVLKTCFSQARLVKFQCNNSVLIKASWSWPCYNPEQYAAIIKWGFKDLSEDDKLQQFTPSWSCRCPWFNPFISSAAPITFQLPSTLDNLHDKRVLYPVIKVLYALHTLLERIAASKTLQRERG